MAKKRVKNVKVNLGRNKKPFVSKKVEDKKPAHVPKKKPFLSGFFEKKKPSPSQEYRNKEESDLRKIQHDVSFLWSGEPQPKKPVMVLHNLYFCSVHFHCLYLNLCNLAFRKHRVYEYDHNIFIHIHLIS